MKHYYYSYLENLINFLLPRNARTLRVNFTDVSAKKHFVFPSSQYDYVVFSDVLGFVDDVESFLREAKKSVSDSGRLIITQYSTLWEPILRLATFLRLRRVVAEQNWLSPLDLKNFSYLAGWEVVKSGTKMILPVYIPFLSYLCNRFLANLWPFSRLGLIHYLVVRKLEVRDFDNKPTLSIIVAARNEAGTIEKIVKELPSLGSSTEIIFVEGGSTDNTWAEIKRVASDYSGKKRVLAAVQDGKGIGDAVRKGFDLATGDILTIYNADMTVPPEEIIKFYNSIAENRGDFINGSRLVYPMEKESMRLCNFLGNKFFSLAFSWIIGQPIKDTLCGTKMLWRKDYQEIKSNRAFFGDFDPFGDFDLLFGAAKLNLKIIDLPVHYRRRVYGETNISRWSHGWLLLKMTVFAAKKIKFI